MTRKKQNLAILIFDDAEVLDFCGPFEVFSVANNRCNDSAFRIFTVAGPAGFGLVKRGTIGLNDAAERCSQYQSRYYD